MKLPSKQFFLSLIVVGLLTGLGSAQVARSTPGFGSFGGGPFDTVNLGNLNTHFAIPVLHKAGRGMPFHYDLTYDSSIWVPVTSQGVKQWQPVGNWGWNAATASLSGYVTFDFADNTLPGPPCTGEEFLYTNYVYHDSLGRAHPFAGSTWFKTIPCIHPPTRGSGPLNATATDGSGFSITAALGVWTITSVSGKVIGSTSPTVTDANGNQLTVNTNGQYFDTLSSTTPVLTVAGSGTPASPSTFTYTAPSGGNASYTMNYAQYTVATNFSVTGIREYGGTSISLVSSITLPDQTSYAFTYEQTPGSCTPLSGTQPTCVTGRIASTTLPTGGTVTYAYNGGNNGIYSDGSTAGLSRTLSPGGTWTYSRALQGTVVPGPGSAWVTTVTDPSTPANYTVINFAEDSATTTNITAATYNFYETQRQVYQGSVASVNLLATSIRCYNGVYTSCPTSTVGSPINTIVNYNQLPNGSTRASSISYNGWFLGSGLVSDDKEYGYGVTLGAAPSSTYLIRETVTTYAALGNGIFDKPASVTVSDWSSGTAVTLASSTYSYDQPPSPAGTTGTPQHVAVTGARGNLTTVATQVNATTTLSKTFSYYDTGTPHVATDVNGTTTTTYTYSTAVQGSSTASCGNSFPTTVAVSGTGVSLSASTVWNCPGGVATQSTDPNVNTVSSDYTTDPSFWRPASVSDQLSNQTKIAYIGSTAAEAALQQFNGGNSSSDSLTTVDGFGRPIFSQRKQGPSATNYDTTETDYNSLGQPYRSTMPYSAGASPSSPNTAAPVTTTTYDALGRVVTITDPNSGTVSYTYTNNDVLQKTIGAQAFQKQFEYDGLGRLISVCEMSSTLPGVGSCGQSTTRTGYWTTYAYDALGRLLKVTQNAQAAVGSRQTRTIAYDMAGRVTSESNPETGNGGTNGTVSYVYDSISPCADGTNYSYSGDLVQKKDNAGNCTCFAYDGLHRLLKAGNKSVANTTIRQFTYDSKTSYPSGVTVANGKSRLIEATTINSSTLSTNVTDEFFSYSPRGEVTDVYESTPHSGGYYHTTTSYWPTGSLKTLSGIPGVPTLNYGANGAGLDGEGRPTQVTTTSGNLVTNVTYSTASTTNPLGALTGVTYGSLDSDSFTYDPNTGQPSSYTFSVNGVNDKGTLTWNTNGTLAKLVTVDSIAGTADSQNCNYLYDDVQRVSSANCGTPWGQTFTYDPFGNITKTGSSAFRPGYSATQNQFTSIPGVTSKYDANGNLLTDNLNTYTWDPNWGNMLSVKAGSTTITATYDARGLVVEQYNGTAYSEILYSPVGKTAIMNGTALTKAFVGLPGGGVAVYNSLGLAYYRHSDWLGSSRLASTPSRTSYASSAYAPFGELYGTSGVADASFTGQNRDTVSSLYDFAFRENSPSQGRWISPDPSGRGAVNPGNPQSWNRYAYVTNNPLSFTDPKGLNRQGPGGGGCNTDEYNCFGGGGTGDSGSGGGSGFCDASGNCGAGTGVNGMPGVGGIPWSFGPGYNMSSIAGTASLMAGQSRYLSIINTGWDPALGINWNNVNYLAQANGQYNRLSGNLSALFGDIASADPTNCDLIGGHCNFALTCTDLSSCGPGRYDDGVHIENVDGALWVHDDTVSPWTGAFSPSAFFTGNFWEHGFVDLIGGTFFVGAFPQ